MVFASQPKQLTPPESALVEKVLRDYSQRMAQAQQ